MKKYTVILIVVLAASVLFAGCGGSGSSVEGVYKVKAGDSFTATLTLKADGKATYSITDSGEGIPLEYKVKDDTVFLLGADGKEADQLTFKIADGGLRDFAGNLYEKQ